MKRNLLFGFSVLCLVAGIWFVADRASAQKDSVFDTSSGRPSTSFLVEDFAYVGALNAYGWTAHSGTGTNPPSTTPGLTFAGYPGSNIGNAALVGNSGGEDVNRDLSAEQTGDGTVVYYSALINVTETASDKTGDYVLHIGDRAAPDSFTLFAARLFVRVVGNAVNFGLSNTSTATYGTTNFAKNTTYLVIVKYTISTAGNDTTSLWVIPTNVPATEAAAGTPEVTNSATAGQDVIDAVALRQGSNANSAQVVVDGIRIGSAWSDLVAGGGATPTPTPSPSPSPTPTPVASPTPTPGTTTPRRLFTARLTGAQEVPAVTTNGRGFGRVVLNAAETEITASFYWEGLGSNVTLGHIHGPAVAGVNAPVLFNMNPTTGVTSGRTVDRVFAVTPAQVADLRAGLWYFNIHTVNNGGGEIRGQILSNLNDAPLDFNADGKTDFGVVRPTAAVGGTQTRWYNLINAPNGDKRETDFGVVTDFITPGDFDGDGKDDIAIWRSATGNSTFFILQSSTNTVRYVRFGIPNDDPFVIGDYDGDGIDDPAIFRKGETDGAQSQFWWYGSYGVTKNVEVVVNWGVGVDVASPGDFNGDGISDFCVYRGVGTPARGVFYIHYGTGGFDATSPNDTQTRFGLPNDAVVPGDYDGDGKTDLAVTRVEGPNIAWYYVPSSGGTVTPRLAWGRIASDIEVQGDYDGDGKTDLAVWRSQSGQQSLFLILLSSNQSVQYQFWGLFGDQPAAQDTHL